MEGVLCRHALGIMVERLPGATAENIEKSIENLETIEKKGLRSFLDRVEDSTSSNEVSETSAPIHDNEMFRSFEESLDNMLTESFTGLGQSIRFCKYPVYTCGCNVDKIWRALRLLPLEDVQDIVTVGTDIEVN